LINTKESFDYSEVGSLFLDGQGLKHSKFPKEGNRAQQTHEIRTWTKEQGVGNRMMRAPNHDWPEPRALDGEATQPGYVEEEEDDEAGQDTTICKKQIILLGNGNSLYNCFITVLCQYVHTGHSTVIFVAQVSWERGHL
jgi:hypothetical protein